MIDSKIKCLDDRLLAELEVAYALSGKDYRPIVIAIGALAEQVDSLKKSIARIEVQ